MLQKTSSPKIENEFKSSPLPSPLTFALYRQLILWLSSTSKDIIKIKKKAFEFRNDKNTASSLELICKREADSEMSFMILKSFPLNSFDSIQKVISEIVFPFLIDSTHVVKPTSLFLLDKVGLFLILFFTCFVCFFGP